ncbi:Uncharacterised protein [Mycobacteroides abscessus subsp. massiliense]|uniref:hypothetical protein n=1 Tax=Mycobacteroides abscessus TaxID=36809 RepID=UPI0009D10B16|nr:hypothetical protein [Mycobacteroides abscessus]SLE84347.1 Uncharacterised protein [Mycobacteroides abscessus subsp. massiliense]
MDGFVNAVGETLTKVRDLYGRDVPITPSVEPSPRSPGQTGWSGSASEREQGAVRALDDRRNNLIGADKGLDNWARDLANDSAAGRSSANQLIRSYDATTRALGPYARDNLAARAALIQALTAHVDSAGNLVAGSAANIPARQQMLAALAAEYGIDLDRRPAGPRRPRRRPRGGRRSGRGMGGGMGAGGAGMGGALPKLGGGSGGGFSMPDMGSLGRRPGGLGAGGGSAAGSGAGLGPAPIGGPASLGNIKPDQMQNAKWIIAEAQRRHLSPRAAKIAIATALQESGLRVLANPGVPESMRLPNQGTGHDHDSVGLFQQRQSWGATRDLMNPSASAGKFYDQLVRVAGWQSMPLTQAAQRVQRSAFPSAYAKHEPTASAIVDAVWGAAA